MRSHLRLTLLGGFRSCSGAGAHVDVPTHRYRALLAYLALPPGRAHPRDKLVALLWPDLARAQGRTRLRQAVLALRRALGRSARAALSVEGDTIALRTDAVTVDAIELEQLARADDAGVLERAGAVYGGELLAGLPVHVAPFEEWLGAERLRCAELVTQALARLLVMRRDAGAPEAAVQVAHRLLALDPLYEPAHRALIELYQRLGRRADALRQYQVCVNLLARELDAEPGPETRALYLQVLRGEAAAVTLGDSGQAIAWMTAAGAGPLVGRVTERGRLRDALEAAIQGTGSVLVITGEAGMGKSRLTAELAANATGSGALLLLGQCHETDQILAFGPWADALRHAVVGRLAAVLDGLGPVRRRELARLLPELATEAPPAGGEPLPLFDAVAALLARLSETRPVVLVLEDLHWADEMSIRLLAFLAHRLRGYRLLVVATARPEELDDAPFVRRALDALTTVPQGLALELGPLSRDETAALVRALAPTEAAGVGTQVWSLSEGHPFTAVEMVAMVRQDSGADVQAIVDLPRRVRSAVALRLERLGERARRLVEVAAVIGRQFDVALLGTAADLEDDAVVDGLEELVRRRLVESVGEGFRFVHHRVLEAARPTRGPRRARVHRRVAEAIETRHAADLEPHLGALADHYQRAGVWERAAGSLQRLGDLDRRRGAYREALVSYQTGLDSVSRAPRERPTLELELDLRLGMRYALVPLGEVPRVIGSVEPARRIAERLDDRRRLGWAELFLSEARRWLGEYSRAIEAAGRARALATDLHDRDLVILSAVFLASEYGAQGRHAEATPLLEDTVAAVRLDDPGVTRLTRPAVAAAACGWLARTLVLRGELERVPGLLEEAMQHGEAVDSPHALAVACTLVGETRTLLGDPAGALSVLERGLTLCQHAEIQHSLAMLEAATGYARTLAGRAAEGLRLLEAAVARADAQQQRWLQPQRLAWLADAQRRRGRRAAAVETASRATVLARQLGERDSEGLALRVQQAAVSVTSGRPSTAPPIARGPASSGRRRRRR